MKSFKGYLNEVFDSPHDLKETDPDDMMGFMIKTAAEMKGAQDVKLHSDDKDHMYATWHHDGAMEIHHFPPDGQAGFMSGGNKPNPRFISTALKLGSDHLDSGGKVRIVTTEDLIPHFKPLGERVTKRMGLDMNTTKIHDTSFYAPFPINLHAIEVSKKTK